MDVLVQAFFQTSPLLSVTMLGILKSAEMIGRVVGGCVQYAVEIPVKRRYVFTKAVYLFYEMTDAVLLFLPYPLMLAGRFLCGGLGISSATIRETAVQSYLKPGMRARVNAFFDVAVSLGCVAFQLLAGLGNTLKVCGGRIRAVRTRQYYRADYYTCGREPAGV